MISAQPNILITLQYSQTTTLTYLSGPGGLYALHLINPDESENIHYIHTDHLGSWTKITNEDGKQVDEQSYDAWGGNRRNPATWQTAGMWQTPCYDRGFTGHEHLDGFQLINMNGRMYDPVVSRMLAPDNFVQTPPDFSQNFNRYSYALNNPLKYTDPDGGEFIIEAIMIGAFINTTMQLASGKVNSVGDFFLAAGIGAASGAAGGAGVGGAVAKALTFGGFSGGAIAGAYGGFYGGLIGGGAGNAWAGGANLGIGLQEGLKAAFSGALVGGFIGGTLAGVDALRSDASFWDGGEYIGEVGGGGKWKAAFLNEKILQEKNQLKQEKLQ